MTPIRAVGPAGPSAAASDHRSARAAWPWVAGGVAAIALVGTGIAIGVVLSEWVDGEVEPVAVVTLLAPPAPAILSAPPAIPAPVAASAPAGGPIAPIDIAAAPAVPADIAPPTGPPVPPTARMSGGDAFIGPPEVYGPPPAPDLMLRLSVDLVVHVPSGVPRAARNEVADALRAAGWAAADPVAVEFRIRDTHMRFYHAADRPGAAAAAAALDVPLRDFTDYRPSPRTGLVEVWVAGRPAAAAAAQPAPRDAAPSGVSALLQRLGRLVEPRR